MKRGVTVYFALCVVIIILLVVRAAGKPAPVDWSENLSRYYRSPYGTALLYDRLPDLFPAGVSTSHDRFRQMEWARDADQGPRTHIIIMSYFEPDDVESNALLRLAYQGDDVFIAASDLSDTLKHLLSLHVTESVGLAEKLTVRFTGLPEVTRPYTMDKARYNTCMDTVALGSTVLARNGSSEAVFIHTPYGAGHIWIFTAPLAFTNYQLLHQPNEGFISTVLSFLPKDHPVIWNEHYKVGRLGNPSPLRWLLANTATRWAVYVAMALVLAYMLFRAKREQRAVPVVEPLRNTSRDFVNTIGQLYYRKGDHADLARKMILYFKDEMRQRTYLRQFTDDAATYQHLATKLDLPVEEVARRITRINEMEKATRLSELQLLELNNELGDLRARL